MRLLKAEAKPGLDAQDNYWERKAKVGELSDPDSGLAPVGGEREGGGVEQGVWGCGPVPGRAQPCPGGSLSQSHPLEESCVLLE